jgi:hypothetical protein
MHNINAYVHGGEKANRFQVTSGSLRRGGFTQTE